jgi:hypothetical protein
VRARGFGVGVVALLGAVALSATSCSSATTTTPTTQAPRPAGSQPSDISKQVCQEEAQKDIASALGETAKVSRPTWVNHLYTCDYSYPSGSMILSIKELSSWKETLAYFSGLAAHMGKTRELQGLGQGAFQTSDGSVVVRKDWKVLLVNIADLPARFGVPETSSQYVAVTVADVILGCWAGD